MDETQRSRRVIEVNQGIIGPAPPRGKTVRAHKLSDYPHVPAAYRDVARRLASPLRMGPPVCDELMALVQHVFTEEEAAVARHLGLYKGRRAADLARAEHCPIDEIEPVLHRLADEKRVIAASGGKKGTEFVVPASAGTSRLKAELQTSLSPFPPPDRLYRLPPIMPGIFEMALIGQTPESLSPWHRRFIELFEALCDTGYTLDYRDHATPLVRYLPVGKAIEAHPMALPSDKLEVVLEQFDTFGIGQCQCRMSMQVLGRGCGKPLANCTVMGQWAERGIAEGALRPVSRQQALEIKRQAESHGLVNWMMNVELPRGQCSCSCCGCCCHALRSVTEFNAPGAIAPPHFLPRLEAEKCVSCGRCAKNCPMGAIAVDTGIKPRPVVAPLESGAPVAPGRHGATDGRGFMGATDGHGVASPWRHLVERCIGCGLCALACDRQRALRMEPVPGYRLPYRSWFSLIAHATPGILLKLVEGLAAALAIGPQIFL